MALWKPMMGNRTALNTQEKHPGYAWFCVDDGSFFIDHLDADGNLQRKQINESDLNNMNAKISTLEAQVIEPIPDEEIIALFA